MLLWTRPAKLKPSPNLRVVKLSLSHSLVLSPLTVCTLLTLFVVLIQIPSLVTCCMDCQSCINLRFRCLSFSTKSTFRTASLLKNGWQITINLMRHFPSRTTTLLVCRARWVLSWTNFTIWFRMRASVQQRASASTNYVISLLFLRRTTLKSSSLS